MYRAIELIVPSPINDLPNRPILGHFIFVCCLYLLLCLIHSFINVAHGQFFSINQLQHLNKWLSNCHNLCCYFPKWRAFNYFLGVFYILFAGPLIWIPFITWKNLLQVLCLGKERLQREEVSCKSSNCMLNKPPTLCVSPHQAQYPNVVVDVGDAFGMLYSVLDPIMFAYVLKHEVYAMFHTWSP